MKTSQLVGAEDLKEGDYVTVASEMYELIPLFCDEGWQRDVDPLRVSAMPDDAGCPLKVIQVCLPFVLVKHPTDGHQTLDLRRHRLMRLSRAYGKQAFKRLREEQRAEKGKSR